jgi:hypothetical protein
VGSTHTVTAVYSGDFNYAASNNNAAPLTLTVTKANTTTTSAPSLATLLQFSAESVTATVTSSTTGTPTGTVSFYNGTTLLGPPSTLNSSGVATFTSATLGIGTYTVTAVYNGDGNYSTSTSTPSSFTVGADPADFQLSLSTTSVSIASGSTVQTTLYVSPTNTLAGTITFACSGLPSYATCTFGPPSTLTVQNGLAVGIAGAPATNTQTYWQQQIPVAVTFWSDVAPVKTSLLARQGNSGTHSMLAFGWPVMLIGLGALARRRLRRSGSALFIALFCLLAGASMTLSGCGSAVNGAKFTTPAGTSSVSITVTAPGSTTHTIVAQYTVTGAGF